MIILAIIVLGMVVGWLAQFILGRAAGTTNWGLALFAGLAGSFVGATLFSLLSGDGFTFKPSGLIGSVVGALIITAVYQWASGRGRTDESGAVK